MLLQNWQESMPPLPKISSCILDLFLKALDAPMKKEVRWQDHNSGCGIN